jgi:hypothetical protein
MYKYVLRDRAMIADTNTVMFFLKFDVISSLDKWKNQTYYLVVFIGRDYPP